MNGERDVYTARNEEHSSLIEREVVAFTGSLAVAFLEKSIENGNEVEIPSLGIKLSKKGLVEVEKKPRHKS